MLRMNCTQLMGSKYTRPDIVLAVNPADPFISRHGLRGGLQTVNLTEFSAHRFYRGRVYFRVLVHFFEVDPIIRHFVPTANHNPVRTQLDRGIQPIIIIHTANVHRD